MQIKKEMTVITDDRYKDPKTIPLIFRFEPHTSESSQSRIENGSITHIPIEGKDLYFFDGLFTQEEALSMREYSSRATFSREIFASAESIAKGQEATRSMDSKEKWQFFANPPSPIRELYKLLSLLSAELDIDIATFPWDLVRGDICSPAMATNLIRSHANMELDKHRDADPESKGIAFGIPVLYAPEKGYHPNYFVNGEVGRPWLVSLMLYSTEANFLPQYGMGTVFYKDNGEMAARADCLHMRLVLFEGNIIHSVENSALPEGVSTQRISYVFKLTMNPRRANQSAKEAFLDWVRKAQER